MNGMPITMLNGMGCADCGGTCSRPLGSLRGLGAITRSEIEQFFIGKNKYVKNTRPTPVYKAPGEAPFKTVAPNDTIGMVVSFNDKANWAKLSDGNWINTAAGAIDSFYTVILTTPPPTSVSDAVGRELDKIPFIPSAATLKLILWAVVIGGAAILVMRVSPPKQLKTT